MRYAIVSDVHANLQAWQAVDTDIRNHGADSILCLGDVVGYGPDPVRVLDAVYDRVAANVIGNHDAVVAGTLDPEIFNDDAKRLIEWTVDQLADDAGDYFAELPYKMSDGDILCVHAEAAAPDRFDYVVDSMRAHTNFEAVDNRIIFLGHTHVPGIFVKSPSGAIAWQPPNDLKLRPDHRYIVNVGSVGDPRDDNPRASYCLFDANTNELAFRRVQFDYEAYRRRIAESGLQTSPRCLVLLDHGVASLRKAESLSDMAIKDAPTRLKQKTAPATQIDAITAASQQRGSKGKRKFGKPRRARTLRTLPAATTEVSLPAAADAPPAERANSGPWILVAAAVLLIAAGGYGVSKLLPQRRQQRAAAKVALTETPTTRAADADPTPATSAAPTEASASEPPGPAPPTTGKTAIIDKMTAVFATAKARQLPPRAWPLDNKSLAATNSDEVLGIDGSHELAGNNKLNWLQLDDATVTLPYDEGLTPPLASIRFWLKLDSTDDTTILSLNDVELRLLDGKLELRRGTQSETGAPGVPLTQWNHVVVNRNQPDAGQYAPAYRVYVNGERVATLDGDDLVAGPLTPIRFPNLSGSLSRIRVEPRQWLAQRIKTDHTEGRGRLFPESVPAPAAPKTEVANATPAKLAPGGDYWPHADPLARSAAHRPITIFGPARYAATGSAGFIVLPAQASAQLPPPIADNVQHFTLQFWFRSTTLTDRTLLQQGPLQLQLRNRRLQLVGADFTAPSLDVELQPDTWYNVTYGHVRKGTKGIAVFGLYHESRQLVEQPLEDFPITEPLVFPSSYLGLLGPCRLLPGGPFGIQPDANQIWLEVIAPIADQPLPTQSYSYRYPFLPQSPFAEAAGGPALTGSPTIKPLSQGSIHTLHLGDDGAAAELTTAPLAASTIGATLTFRFKPAPRAGLLFKFDHPARPLSATLDDDGTLTLISRDKPLGSAPTTAGQWHQFTFAWNASDGTALLNGTPIFSDSRQVKFPPPRFPVTFGSAVNGQTAEFLLANLAQAPFRLSPEQLKSLARAK